MHSDSKILQIRPLQGHPSYKATFAEGVAYLERDYCKIEVAVMGLIIFLPTNAIITYTITHKAVDFIPISV